MSRDEELHESSRLDDSLLWTVLAVQAVEALRSLPLLAEHPIVQVLHAEGGPGLDRDPLTAADRAREHGYRRIRPTTQQPRDQPAPETMVTRKYARRTFGS